MGKKKTVQILVVAALVVALVLTGLVYTGYGSKLMGRLATHIGTPVITQDVPAPGATVKASVQTRFNWEVDDGGYDIQSNLLCIWDANLGKGAPRYCTSSPGNASERTIGGAQTWTQVLNTLYGATPRLTPYPRNPLSWYAKVKYFNSYGDMVETTSTSREFTLKK